MHSLVSTVSSCDCVFHRTYYSLQKLNGCFDLAVVIVVAVLSDAKEDKSLSFLVILRKIISLSRRKEFIFICDTKEDKLRKIKLFPV